MAKNTRNKNTSKSHGAYYLILIGVIILLIGLAVIFAHSVVAGGVLLLIGVLVSVLGLSKHSLHLLKRKRA